MTGRSANLRGLTLRNLVPYKANAGAARRVYSTAHPAGGDVEPGSYPCAPFLPTTLRSGAGTFFSAEPTITSHMAVFMVLAHGQVDFDPHPVAPIS